MEFNGGIKEFVMLRLKIRGVQIREVLIATQ